MLTLLWLIPLLPFAGFVVNGMLGGRYLPRKVVAVIGCGVVLLSFLISLGAITSLSSLPPSTPGLETDAEAHRVTQTLWTWMPLRNSGDLSPATINWAYTLDPLSAVMLLVVTGVGFLIHIYSIGYMGHEDQKSFARFFCYLNLFMAMMLTLVLGSSLPVLFVGWEGVGLCSYLLIGFYTDRMFDEKTKMSCSDAGRKAFIVNRVGDMGFMLGMLLLFTMTGTLEIQGILSQVGALGVGVCTAAGLLLFFGACGKSAQIPLYVWLPDAMAGPTPVSALIHAATMVTAGVYMVCRMAPVFLMAPAAMTTVAVVGAATALFAAIIGTAQDDIKKVLAYSTVSQLGYMMLAAGVGAFGAGIFHLMTHAFFKALLFLGAGSVIHAMSDEQNIQKMGGLARKLPLTHITFLVAVLAIAGVPPLSGFFSKDEILWFTLAGAPGSPIGGSIFLWGIGVLTAALTAFYMMRLYLLVFSGDETRADEKTKSHIHESPSLMTGPLVVLAIGAIVVGFLGVPHFLGGDAIPNYFEHYLEPVFGHGAPDAHGAVDAAHGAGAAHGTADAHGGAAAVGADSSHGAVAAHAAPMSEWAALVITLIAAGAGLALGWMLYGRRPATKEEGAEGGLLRLVRNKFYVDEAINVVVLRPYKALCRFASSFDTWVVDGLVNATGIGTDLAGEMARLLQTGYVRNYALAFFLGTVVILYFVLG